MKTKISNTSKQKIILKYIILNIMSGTWKPNIRIKSRIWFTIYFDISLSTVKKVFRHLILIHLIYIDNKKYFVSDLRKEGILNTNLIQNKQHPKSVVIKKGNIVTFKELLDDENWIKYDDDKLDSKYYNYEKIITINKRDIRKTEFFFPIFLKYYHDYLTESFLKFLALNGFIIENKIEITNFVVINKNGFIKIREIMYGENKKILKIATHYIVPEFYEKKTRESLFV